MPRKSPTARASTPPPAAAAGRATSARNAAGAAGIRAGAAGAAGNPAARLGCRVRAAARAGARSWTVRAALAVPVLVAALEAAQAVWPEVREAMPAGAYVAGSVLVSALIAALRVRSIADAGADAPAAAGQDAESDEVGGCEYRPVELRKLSPGDVARYRAALAARRSRKEKPLAPKENGGGTQ